ncbi:MATE family efflux transporter [Hominisplanchenecus murintestinalis]|uniref:MATE family efflux transporter n=1 Tax=Hominisplanchenecus murintestinalis TaxID=2941517 RepID=UPI0020402545|nr:MATE family efflux transporter [Hominisplanchenecus murintestinalis]
MNIQLSDHFNCRRLLRFTLPSIVMMIFTSVYGVVDGFFVSNFVGKTSFAAVNFIMPFLMILGAVGFMFGAGGGALIAKTMGEGRHEKAQKLFSLFVYVTVICGIVIAVLGSIFIRPIAAFLGAEGTMLDALFVAVLPWGLVGAAAATAASQCLGGVIPLIYFGSRNTSLLRLRKWEMDGRALLRACTNGSSELMSNISMSIVSMLYNSQLIRYAGEDGIAAYGVLMYVNFVFLAAFIGYSTGTAPIIGYHYGAGNHRELKSLRKKSFLLIVICSGGMFMLAELLAKPLGGIFVGYDQNLLDLTVRAFTIYSFSFLFAGIAIFGSSFFTALNDGLTSAVISFLRTLVFQAAAVLLFPLYFGIDGIWLSIVAAEWMAMLVTLMFIVGKRKKYRY